MPKMKHVRKQLFVDPKVQGALVGRVILYWLICIITITLMLLCWRIVTGPARMFYMHFNDMWFFYGPAMLASLALLPLVVIDIIRLSNRFAGPLLRLRRSMRELAQGEHVDPIVFREGDFWQEFAEEFNALAARVQGQAPAADPFPEEQAEEETQEAREEHEEPVAAGIE